MKVRTLTLAVCAAATALLLPALQTGAAAESPGQAKKASPSPAPSPTDAPEPACAVVVDPATSTGAASGPVTQSASLENDPVQHPTTLGYYVQESSYPRSSTFRATITYAPPATGGCGSISLVTYPLVAQDGQSTYLEAVQSRTVQLTGSATSVTIDSLVVGLPANSKSNSAGLCVGSQIEVRDAAGAVTARFPQSGPLDFCPVPGGRTYV